MAQRRTLGGLRKQDYRGWQNARKAEARPVLEGLRAELRQLVERRKRARARTVAICRRNRKRLQKEITRRRAEERQRLNAEFSAWRSELCASCRKRKAAVRDIANEIEREKKSKLRQESDYWHTLIYGALGRSAEPPRLRSTARERAQESDEAVLKNLDEDLHTIWHRVKSTIKGSARISRTEKFLAWLEENPDEALVLGEADAERELRREIREHERAEQAAFEAQMLRQKPAEFEELEEGISTRAALGVLGMTEGAQVSRRTGTSSPHRPRRARRERSAEEMAALASIPF